MEINPIIARTIMQERFPELSHGLYLRPEVHVVVEDGRSFVRRSADKYQVLQATLVDTWASTAAGAFALSENNLYTTDAFYDYLTHLTDDGLLAFTRWGFDPPRESLRLLSLAMEALSRLGENDPWRTSWSSCARMPQNSERLGRAGYRADLPQAVHRCRYRAGASRALADRLCKPVYLPGDPPVEPVRRAAAHAAIRRRFRRSYRYDVSPVSDDRPFFFYTVQPRDFWNFLRHAGQTRADYKINRAVPLLFGLLAVSLLATAHHSGAAAGAAGQRVCRAEHGT